MLATDYRFFLKHDVHIFLSYRFDSTVHPREIAWGYLVEFDIDPTFRVTSKKL